MATRMQQRRGTASTWTSANPILAAGEIGFEIDTNKFKIGDGTNRWANLTYFSDAAALASIVDGAPALLNTLNELAAAVNDDPTFFTTVATNLSNHESDTTNIHGIANTADLATKSYADQSEADAISTASSDATTKANAAQAAAIAAAATDATTKANAAQAAAEATASADATTKANAAKSGAEATAASALSAHESDTTNIHGIANTADLATKSYVDTAESDANSYTDQKISDLIAGAPNALDTLNELAAALGDDENYASTITNALALKAPLESPTFTGTVTLPSNTVTNTMLAGSIANNKLANSSITIGTTPISLGSSSTTIAGLTALTFGSGPTNLGSGTAFMSYNGTNWLVISTDLTTLISGNIITISGSSNDPSYPTVDINQAWTITSVATSQGDPTAKEYYITALDTMFKNASVSGGFASSWGIFNIAGSTASTLKTISDTEIGYLDGVTSSIQTQIDSKLTSSTASSTYAPLASPGLTGIPTAPTAALGTNTTQLATTAFVDAAIEALASRTLVLDGGGV